MKISKPARFGALLVGLVLCADADATSTAPVATAAPPRLGRPWTAETSVEMRHFALDFATPQHWSNPHDDPSGILFSPDGRYFLFLEYRGDVAADAAVARVTIYASDAVRSALRSRASTVTALRRFEMRSRSSTRPAMASLRWDEDSRGLLFEGFDETDHPYIFFYNVEAGALTALGESARGGPQDRSPAFSYRNGTSLLLATSALRRPPPSYRGQWLDRTEDGTPLFDDLQWLLRQASPHRLSRSEARCDNRPAPTPDIAGYVADVAIAPSGCRALLTVARDGGGWDVRLLDVATGASRVVAAARSGRQNAISWSPDGRWALLSNVRGSEGASGSPMAFLSLETSLLTSPDGLGAAGSAPGPRAFEPRWLTAGRLVIADPASPTGATQMELRNGLWVRRVGAALPTGLARARGFSVGLRQGQNLPPRIVAQSGRVEIDLAEPDPVLRGVARQDWREISWVLPTGATARAALLLPAPRPGRTGPPPLVVNPYWYENYLGQHRRLFLPDGLHDGAESAAQALAARGMAVLWMDGWQGRESIGEGEGDAFVARLDSVLEQLIREGLVDPERIGMAGYSRGGYLTLYSATHPGRVAIRTHMAIDNFLGSSATTLYDLTNLVPDLGLGNFASDRRGWNARDTLMNVDRVRGPVLFTRNLRGEGDQPESLRQSVGLRTMAGAFMMARRPFDQLHFPEGVHNLLRPSERVTLINAMSDWMAFWLMDETPADAGRARIWAQLRDQWRRQQAWEAAGHPIGSAPAAGFAPAGAAPETNVMR